LQRDASEKNGSQLSVVAETLAYAEVNDDLVKGHFVFPEDMVETLPAIILVHEWWGLNDEFRALADRIAAEGFVVLAVDLYGGETAKTPPDARKLMLKIVENPQFAAENLRQACDWVSATAGATQVGVVGYGFGGGWSLNAAMALPDQLDAAVIFYGQVSDNEQDLAPIAAPLLGFFGDADNTIPLDAVHSFELALQNLDKTFEIEIYPGAGGGFASPRNRNFDANLEAESWRKMLQFLRENLREPEQETA
jgi:carboxymethylenebutenolidase